MDPARRRNLLLVAGFAVHVVVLASPYYALLTLLASGVLIAMAAVAEHERQEANPFGSNALGIVGLAIGGLVLSLVVALAMSALGEVLFGPAPH